LGGQSDLAASTDALPLKFRKFLVLCCMWLCGLVPGGAPADQENCDDAAAQRCWVAFKAPKLDTWTSDAALKTDPTLSCCPPFCGIDLQDAAVLRNVVDQQLVAWSTQYNMPMEVAQLCICHLLRNTGVCPAMVKFKGLTDRTAFTFAWNALMMPSNAYDL
jgi:hypothetical protein